jgi:hypothetical protein
VPDCVNTSVNAVQPLCRHAAPPGAVVDSDRFQLRDGNDSVLVRGDSGYDRVRVVVGEFPSHVGRLIANASNLAPSSPVFVARRPGISPFIAGLRPNRT